MLRKRVPGFYLILSAITGSLITILIFNLVMRSSAHDNNLTNANSEPNRDDDYIIKRDPRNFKYISPIISIEPKYESEKYTLIKSEIEAYIAKEKENNSLISASVYLRDFTKGDWIAVNPKEIYNPGSLLKVGVLITYMRMAETDPDLLKMEVVYNGIKGFIFPFEHFINDTVKEGKKYKITELLEYMIKYSDNRATVFLENHMDTTIFKNEFSDLGISKPRFNDPTYALNVQEYSMMFKALYNAGYLRKTASENSLEMLTKSTFKDGLLKELPEGTVIAHKFGEAGDQTIHELHESGIIYLNNNPYMITIMTKGTDWNKLSDAIGHISKMVYDKMSITADGSKTLHSGNTK